MMNVLLSQDSDSQRLVFDVFAPPRRLHYYGLGFAQSLFSTPTNEQTEGSYVYGTLLDTVKFLFSPEDTGDYPLQSLIDFTDKLALGSFTITEVTSYELDHFSTSLQSGAVFNKLSRPNCMHSCESGMIGKHSPYFSVRFRMVPFWKRIVRIGDVFIAFLGSTAVPYLSNENKIDLIMRTMGPMIQSGFSYNTIGSFRVLEVYSSTKGFGIGYSQAVFYLLLLQDPKLS